MILNQNTMAENGNVRYGGEMRVLIVGGGIAGLTLAVLLRQRGFTPDVILVFYQLS